MSPPLLAISSTCSNSGKTTLLRSLLPLLRNAGIRVALIKHSHHEIEIDRPGKDSHALRLAGANPVIITSPQRTALILEHDPEQQPQLAALLDLLPTGSTELILAEGFRHLPLPRIEVFRPSLGRPPLYPNDAQVIAVASDAAAPTAGAPPWRDLNQPNLIADFIQHWIASGG